MTSLFRGLAAISLFLISVASTSAQKVEFSADIRVSDGAWRTQTLRLYVGNMRARFDLLSQQCLFLKAIAMKFGR